MSEVKLLPLPEFPAAVERFILSSLGRMKAEGARTELRTMLRAYARANMEPLLAENERLRTQYQQAAESSEHFAARAERLAEALRWYAEQTALCRKLGSAGDAGRSALDADGGKRARAALDQEGGNG